MHQFALAKVWASSKEEALELLEREFKFACKWSVDYYIVISVIEINWRSRFSYSAAWLIEQKFAKWYWEEIAWILKRINYWLYRFQQEDKNNHKARYYHREMARWYKKEFKLMLQKRWVGGTPLIEIKDKEDEGKLFYILLDYHW